MCRDRIGFHSDDLQPQWSQGLYGAGDRVLLIMGGGRGVIKGMILPARAASHRRHAQPTYHPTKPTGSLVALKPKRQWDFKW